jgi:hypothetical protein
MEQGYILIGRRFLGSGISAPYDPDLVLPITFLFLFVGLGLILAYWYIKYRKMESVGGDNMDKKELEILKIKIDIRDSLTREIAKDLTNLLRGIEF